MVLVWVRTTFWLSLTILVMCVMSNLNLLYSLNLHLDTCAFCSCHIPFPWSERLGIFEFGSLLLKSVLTLHNKKEQNKNILNSIQNISLWGLINFISCNCDFRSLSLFVFVFSSEIYTIHLVIQLVYHNHCPCE